MQHGQTHMTDEYEAKSTHEPLFSNSVSMHDHSSKHLSPTIVHGLNIMLASHPIMHGDEITY